MTYGDVAGFREYMENRGKELSSIWTDDKISSALLVASEWLDSQYEAIWIGYKTNGFKQERSWPRTSAIVQAYPYYTFDKDEIPEQVVKATYEASFRELTSQGYLSVDFTPNKYKSVRVEGAIEVAYNSEIQQSSEIQTQIPIIENLMSLLIDPNKSGTFSSLSGGVTRV